MNKQACSPLFHTSSATPPFSQAPKAPLGASHTGASHAFLSQAPKAPLGASHKLAAMLFATHCLRPFAQARRPLAAFFCLALACSPVASAAPPAPPSIQPLLERPPPTDKPTVVNVGAYIVNITSISEQEQAFEGDVVISVRWQDSRLADPSATGLRTVALSEIWTPRLTAVNRRHAEMLFPAVAELDPQGTVRVVQRFHGSVVAPLRFTEFPFDEQTFSIEVVGRGYSPTELQFVVDQKRTGMASDVGLSGWRQGEMSIRPFRKNLFTVQNGDKVELTGFLIQVELCRRSLYYMLREVLPLVFIVLMASGLFWIPVKEHGIKIGITTASIFSLMAFYVQLGRSMPRLDYFTRMDNFVVSATVLVFMGFAQVIAGMYFVRKDRLTDIERVERWSRAVYPLLLAAILWGSFMA